MDCLDPAFFDDEAMRAALAARDVGAVYRLLRRVGVSQRQIAQVTGQSQSEVCEIVAGRQLQNIWVLERIADGLRIPRAWMGLSYGEQGPHPVSSGQEVAQEVKRRARLASTSAASLGQVLPGLGEPLELALPLGESLPARLEMLHVHTVRAVTERLRGVARSFGGQAGLFGAAVRLYTPWRQVPATEAVTAGLAAALAELHTEAGWCCYDTGLEGTAHFTHALQLAHQGGDSYGVANAAWHAGLTLVRSGHPNDALKLFHLGQAHLRGFRLTPSTPVTGHAEDPRLSSLAARLTRNSATAYAVMGGLEQATRCLAEANDQWTPRDAFEHASADLATARIHRDLGQLESAEQFATSAVRTFNQGHYRRGRILAELLLAEVHIRAGDPHGLTLAHHAINQVSTLHSLAARGHPLISLATALDARPDTQDLARLARQVAATPDLTSHHRPCASRHEARVTRASTRPFPPMIRGQTLLSGVGVVSGV
jgi:tetratricopeptide (TPR) repeat protein